MESERLKRFYFELEKDKKVTVANETVSRIQNDIESIVNKILQQISVQDNRFKFEVVKTGSFYDEAKVGEPDEFDYVAELTTLSRDQRVKFLATSDPAFLQIKLDDFKLIKKWQEFMCDPYNMQKYASDISMSHVADVEEYHVSDDNIMNDKLYLDPSKIQRHFKKMFEQAMEDLKLPDGWEHNGYNRPAFSGVRRHGPATMIMLIYRTPNEEFKITVDVTLGIALKLPVIPGIIKMNVLERIPNACEVRNHIQQCLKRGPCLHAIPLYSRMLVSTGNYLNKTSFRVSCSGIEKSLFDRWSQDSGPKKYIRIVKALRDIYFADGSRKTRRSKKMRKTLHSKKITKAEKSLLVNSVKVESKKRQGISHIYPLKYPNTPVKQRYNRSKQNANTSVIKTIKRKYRYFYCRSKIKFNTKHAKPQIKHTTQGSKRNKFSKNEKPKTFTQSTKESEMRKQKLIARLEVADRDYCQLLDKEKDLKNKLLVNKNNDIEQDMNPDTTDLTDTDINYSTEEAKERFNKMKDVFQSQDVSDMTPNPGSGEYYGPKTYMSSIEIKAMLMVLLTKQWNEEEWTDDYVFEYVEAFLKFYHELLKSEKMIKHFFFDQFVCSPPPEEKRVYTLEKYNTWMKDRLDIMLGKETYKSISNKMASRKRFQMENCTLNDHLSEPEIKRRKMEQNIINNAAFKSKHIIQEEDCVWARRSAESQQRFPHKLMNESDRLTVYIRSSPQHFRAKADKIGQSSMHKITTKYELFGDRSTLSPVLACNIFNKNPTLAAKYRKLRTVNTADIP